MSATINAAGRGLVRITNLPSITGFTIMGWARVTTSKVYNCFFAIGAVDAEPFYFYGTNGLSTYMYTLAVNDITNQLLTINTWYHVALVCSGNGAGGLNGYINGVLDIAGNGLATVAASKLYLGNDNSGYDHYLAGDLANVSVYDSVLTPTQIAAQMAYRRPIIRTNLNSWYPLISDAKDYSGNGYDMTTNGAVTYTADPPTANLNNFINPQPLILAGAY